MISQPSPIPLFHDDEHLYIGIDIGKKANLVAFVSARLLSKRRHTTCPTIKIENSRSGYEHLIEEIQRYAPLHQCSALMEKTGHYHLPLRQHLQDCGVQVYELHVQKRLSRIKNDRRDAQGLGNLLYNQVALGVHVNDSEQIARLVRPATEVAQALYALTQRKYELSQSGTRIKNKLTAIYDELFPEFSQVISDPFSPTSLALRERFPTAHDIASASFEDIKACRAWRRPSDEDLRSLQQMAQESIGVRTPGRVGALAVEQHQLIEGLRLIQQQNREIESAICTLVEESREGQILLSMGVFGPNQVAVFLAVVGSITNTESASRLKGLTGWYPVQSQTGTSMDKTVLSKEGNRLLRNTMFLVGMHAIQGDNEWHELYDRLVPRICQWDERLGRYRGKRKALGHIIGRILAVAYALLKQDHDLVAATPPGEYPPPPTLYSREIHRGHRQRRQA